MPGKTVLDELTKERLLRLLAAARELVTGDLRTSAAPLEAVLSEAGDRVAALRVVQALGERSEEPAPEAGGERGGERAGRPDASAVLSSGGEPVTEFRLIPFGHVRVERPAAGGDFTFTRSQAAALLRWFDGIGRKLAIDYEHQSFDRLNTRSDGLRPAAGWIGGLELRDDGLWAVAVQWTERARALLRSGEYRYFSPVIFWSDETRQDVAGLGPVALTNDPAMCGVVALAAKRRSAQQDDENWLTAGGLSQDPDGPGSMGGAGAHAHAGADAGAEACADAEARADAEGATDGVSTTNGLAERLALAEAEVALLRKQLMGQAADAFVEQGLRAGKIIDATSLDWRDEYLRDPGEAVDRLARAPVVLPPGRVVSPEDRTGRTRTTLSTAEAAALVAIDADDLAAFERASAAGRVTGL